MNTNVPYAYGIFVQQDKNNICAALTAALAGLPHYLKEDSSEVLRTRKVSVCSSCPCNYKPSIEDLIPFLF